MYSWFLIFLFTKDLFLLWKNTFYEKDYIGAIAIVPYIFERTDRLCTDEELW